MEAPIEDVVGYYVTVFFPNGYCSGDLENYAPGSYRITGSEFQVDFRHDHVEKVDKDGDDVQITVRSRPLDKVTKA